MLTSINLPKTVCTELRGLVNEAIHICGENLLKIILFGSFATNQYQPDSDFDICLVLRELPSTTSERLRLRNFYSENTVSREVDVVVCLQEELENGDMVFKYIRRDGVILYEQIQTICRNGTEICHSTK